MSALVARRCFVSGLVQGVFFRASTRQQAASLGISGYATNLPDGRVEVLLVGEPDAASKLIEWLHQGPPAARVKRVEILEVDLEGLADVPVGFATR
jgi:acylphosphatase